ncbi:MurR/RpiR family transcriptional regulator [Bradyrhizobium sp. Arg62]|uniref:MurR/RpiR family transcriptional regulator n=1 Tax=Bradyrhizobium brasilense TaxID=1419277 RepID=UPI001E562B74|nr:MurR/RpiR family transcriptional regulator [Bradyrhizobium brasilense]MCC8944224.1 MurR/RpiR family transcriptional regulator [Bradyrhizobium brasilense]
MSGTSKAVPGGNERSAVEPGQRGKRYGALPLVRAHIADLPKALQRIAKYVLENPDLVIRQTASELAIVTQSGPASIVRFSQAIGFAGLQEFKLALTGDLASQRFQVADGDHEAKANTDLTAELADRIVQATRETQSLLDQNAIDRLADAMVKARRIDVYGSVVSGLIGQHLAFRLLRVGLPAHGIVDTTYAASVASGLGPTSVAIAVSETGMTEETVEALRRAKAAGAFTAVITHRYDGPIVKYADEVLLTAPVTSPLTEAKSVIAFTNLMAIEVLASMLTIKLGLLRPAETLD